MPNIMKFSGVAEDKVKSHGYITISKNNGPVDTLLYDIQDGTTVTKESFIGLRIYVYNAGNIRSISTNINFTIFQWDENGNQIAYSEWVNSVNIEPNAKYITGWNNNGSSNCNVVFHCD